MIVRILAAVLVLQLALTAYLYWPRETATAVNGPLIATLSADTVDRVTIRADEDAVTLTRDGDGWRLDSGLPADGAKARSLLQALTGSDPGYPIARSEAAAKRFEVAEDDYQRRIELGAGEHSAVVYLGSSPAFRKVHARAEGSEAVHVLDFNSYDAPSSEASWLDRGLLAVRNIERIRAGDLNLTLGEDAWTTADGEAVDAEAAESLVQALASLRVTGLATAEDTDLAAEGEQRLVLSVDSAGSATELVVIENDQRYFLRSSAYEPLFPTSIYDAERILDAVAELRGEDEREEEEPTEEAADG